MQIIIIETPVVTYDCRIDRSGLQSAIKMISLITILPL